MKGLSDKFKNTSPTGHTTISGSTNPLPVTDAIEMAESAKMDCQEPSQRPPPQAETPNPIDQNNRLQSTSDHQTELNDKVPTTLHDEVEESTKIKIDNETEAATPTKAAQVSAEVANEINTRRFEKEQKIHDF